jgi:ATP-dependent RNA helicase DeaD
VQKNPARVEGTRLGAANADIDHVIHLVSPDQRLDALINILLADPSAQTMIFVRMRVDVADLTRELRNAGFMAAGLSGEMEQRERNQTLADFKRGHLRVLVATDVAARGIDVPDVTRVIHAEPPTNADGYTHRSGRTGRAGRKGVSALLVTTAQIVPVTRVLRQGNIQHRFVPVPTATELRSLSDARLIEDLTRAPAEGEASNVDERLLRLAQQVLSAGSPEQTVARLLARLPELHQVTPRDITPVMPPLAHDKKRDKRREPPPANGRRLPPEGPRPRAAAAEGPRAGQRPPPRARTRAPGPEVPQDAEWVPFRISWGQEHGADARRLLAVVCRRGNIRGTDVGAIRIQRTHSLVNVNADVAERFARSAAKPDPRDPRIKIRLDAQG